MTSNIDRTTRETQGYLGNVHNQSAELLFVPGMTPQARFVNNTITYPTKHQLKVDVYSAQKSNSTTTLHLRRRDNQNTADNISHLCTADRIYCDGTFYTPPPIIDSIFTMHVFVGSAMFPLVFTLLSKRDKHTYTRLFTLLKEICQRHK